MTALPCNRRRATPTASSPGHTPPHHDHPGDAPSRTAAHPTQRPHPRRRTPNDPQEANPAPRPASTAADPHLHSAYSRPCQILARRPLNASATRDSCDSLPCVNVTTSPITPERSRSCPPAPAGSGSSAPTAATSAHPSEAQRVKTPIPSKTNTHISPPTPPPPNGTDNDSTARMPSASSPNADKPAESAVVVHCELASRPGVWGRRACS